MVSTWVVSCILLKTKKTGNLHMVGYSQIEELLQYHDRQHPVMSLYLNLTPPRDFTTELRSLVHAATKELKEYGDYNENQ